MEALQPVSNPCLTQQTLSLLNSGFFVLLRPKRGEQIDQRNRIGLFISRRQDFVGRSDLHAANHFVRSQRFSQNAQTARQSLWRNSIRIAGKDLFCREINSLVWPLLLLSLLFLYCFFLCVFDWLFLAEVMDMVVA